jgi:hypothetical protein
MPAVMVDSPIVIVRSQNKEPGAVFCNSGPLASVFSDSTFCRSALPLRFVIVVRRRIWTDDRRMPLNDCPVHSLRASAVTAAGEYFSNRIEARKCRSAKSRSRRFRRQDRNLRALARAMEIFEQGNWKGIS